MQGCVGGAWGHLELRELWLKPRGVQTPGAASLPVQPGADTPKFEGPDCVNASVVTFLCMGPLAEAREVPRVRDTCYEHVQGRGCRAPQRFSPTA